MVIVSGTIDRVLPFGPLSESSSSFFSDDVVPVEVNNGTSFSFPYAKLMAVHHARPLARSTWATTPQAPQNLRAPNFLFY
jgi:hypothetical protein